MPKPLRYVAEVSYMTQNTAWYKATRNSIARLEIKKYQREDHNRREKDVA